MSLEEITAAIAALPEEERQRLYIALEQQKAGDPAAPARKATKKGGRLSAHDRAQELIGPGSGLGDLSTSPAYMEDFGEARP